MKTALRQHFHPRASAQPRRTLSARPASKAEIRHTALQSMMNGPPAVQRLAALQRVANGGKSLADTSLQRIEDEEDLMQGKMIQREARDDADPLQGKALQRRETGGQGGLPDPLRSGIESLSGLSMEEVQVHRNSAAHAQVGAHAYAQGRDNHLGPGQERDLPHEAWHVVQQAQGRVRPTLQAKGEAINDDPDWSARPTRWAPVRHSSSPATPRKNP